MCTPSRAYSSKNNIVLYTEQEKQLTQIITA